MITKNELTPFWKSCGVDFAKGSIYVISTTSTQMGSFHSEPVIKLLEQDPPVALGEAVLKALNAHQQKRVRFEDLRQMADASRAVILKYTGCKELSEHEGKSKCLSVEFDGATVRIIPSERQLKGGFLYK